MRSYSYFPALEVLEKKKGEKDFRRKGGTLARPDKGRAK